VKHAIETNLALADSIAARRGRAVRDWPIAVLQPGAGASILEASGPSVLLLGHLQPMLGELEPAFLVMGVDGFFGLLATLVRILAELVCTAHRVELQSLKAPRACKNDKRFLPLRKATLPMTQS
jgi:hypothetical protein